MSVDRCEAEDRIERWPYVRRCKRDAIVLNVFVVQMSMELDLCLSHLHEYLESLTLDEARKYVNPHLEAINAPRP